MEYINNYFKEKTKNISFFELRDNRYIEISDYVVRDDLPLPVITDNLIKDIKEGTIESEINLETFIKGIIYLIGVDDSFDYIEEYIKILKAYNANISDYILYLGLEFLEREDLDMAAIYFRALLVIDNEDTNGMLNYAIVLEQIFNKFLEQNMVEEGESFLMQSTNLLEEILNKDENYPLAHYKLGFHYKYFQQYLKASITWSKFLTMDNDHLRLQEIREELSLIDDQVNYETGVTYLTYKDFEKSLEFLLRLLPKYEDDWNINYLIGLSYRGIEEYNTAMEYLYNALDLNDAEADLYNEIAIILFSEGSVEKAISILTKGIEMCDEDYKLYYNRALGYLELGRYENSLKDMDRAFLINPDDENVKAQKDYIEEIIYNR